MLIDTHCHLTFDALREQIDAVLTRADAAGVKRVVTIATTPAEARDAIDMMQTRPNVFLAAGIHPHEAANVTDDDLQALADLHRGRWRQSGVERRLVAVGETGLDFHYDFAPADVQERVFRFQLALACEVNRPVVIHAREAEQRVCGILADYPDLCGRVVFHCFSGDAEAARRILDAGCWIREAARLTPADRIMVETDAPYLSPEPVRKQRPCEPALVVHTARFLADLRGEPFESLARTTTDNAVRFFGLPGQACAGRQPASSSRRHEESK
jgi:TatD DNase family protein